MFNKLNYAKWSFIFYILLSFTFFKINLVVYVFMRFKDNYFVNLNLTTLIFKIIL